MFKRYKHGLSPLRGDVGSPIICVSLLSAFLRVLHLGTLAFRESDNLLVTPFGVDAVREVVLLPVYRSYRSSRGRSLARRPLRPSAGDDAGSTATHLLEKDVARSAGHRNAPAARGGVRTDEPRRAPGERWGVGEGARTRRRGARMRQRGRGGSRGGGTGGGGGRLGMERPLVWEI